jgi:hypothetical protein
MRDRRRLGGLRRRRRLHNASVEGQVWAVQSQYIDRCTGHVYMSIEGGHNLDYTEETEGGPNTQYTHTQYTQHSSPSWIARSARTSCLST